MELSISKGHSHQGRVKAMKSMTLNLLLSDTSVRMEPLEVYLVPVTTSNYTQKYALVVNGTRCKTVNERGILLLVTELGDQESHKHPPSPIIHLQLTWSKVAITLMGVEIAAVTPHSCNCNPFTSNDAFVPYQPLTGLLLFVFCLVC